MSPDLGHAFGLAAGPEAAARVFAYALGGLRAGPGSLLTTASVYDIGAMRSRRVFTDAPATYPTGRYKRLDRNRYFETVIERRRPFAATTIEEIATVFFDWEKIRGLGFESNMNLPAVADGEVIGTVNLLHRRGHFTPDRVALALAWQPVATLAFLLLHRAGAETATFHPGAPAGAGLEG
jgi:GAF domain-containing protein